MKTAIIADYRILRRKGYPARTSIDMARAYNAGVYDLGLEVEWEWDDIPMHDLLDWSVESDYDKCQGYSDVCARCGRAGDRYYRRDECDSPEGHEYHEHEVMYAVVKDGKGNVLASLGGIIDPHKPWTDKRGYAFDVECELYAEAIAELKRNPSILVVTS